LPNAETIPNNSTSGVISFDILSDGNAIDETIQVMSIQVSKTVNRVPFARIAVRDGEAASSEFAISNGDTFAPGKEIEIKIGYDQDNESVFKGVVVKQKVKVGTSGGAILAIECRDKAFAMTLGRKNRYFTDVKDSDALEEILGEYGLSDGVDSTATTHRELVQFHSTDWDFMLTRAEANSLLTLVENGKVKLAKPAVSGSADLALNFGGNLLAFEAEMDARYQWKAVKAQAWDTANQALFESTVTSVDFAENGNISGAQLADVGAPDNFELRHSGFMDTTELQNWAEGAMLKSRLAKIRGRARFIGPVVLRPGMKVELQGVGDRFNGLVYVTGVSYELVDGSCFVDVQFGLSPKWFYEEFPVTAPAAGGLSPGICGLQVGVVKQLEADPDGEERILVYLPLLAEAGDGTWARLASLDAGLNRGWVVRPEIGDEVIVGFINDDPRDAVVLGQLHSSKNTAPIPAADDNHIKGYTSRSEMHVQFDDDQKIITIDTPAGNKLIMSEADTAITIEDQNGNSIVLDPDGIKITSAADITMEAPGNISITASGDLTAEGANVNIAAQAQLKAEGSAGAELSSGGQTVVKGSIVMIN